MSVWVSAGWTSSFSSSVSMTARHYMMSSCSPRLLERSDAQNAGTRRPIDAEASVQGRSGGPATVTANLGESFAISSCRPR